MEKTIRFSIIQSCLLILLLATLNVSTITNAISDMSAIPEHLNKLIEQRIATARLEGEVSAYAQAVNSFGGMMRKSSSWMPSVRSICKIGAYLGIASGIAYGGYVAYKKFAWLRNFIGGINAKIRGATQNWLDITLIKQRIDGIMQRITELAQQITHLGNGQQKMQQDLNNINDQTHNIMNELNSGKLRDGEINNKLVSIEQKVDNLKQLISNNQSK